MTEENSNEMNSIDCEDEIVVCATEEEVTKAESKASSAYFVSPVTNDNGKVIGWKVRKAKAKRALKIFDTKLEAEKFAKQVAKNQNSTVIRQKMDGKIQKKK